MPEYEFTCNKCHTYFSKTTKISEKDSIKCPECDSKDLKEIFSSRGFTTKAKDVCSDFKTKLSGFG